MTGLPRSRRLAAVLVAACVAALGGYAVSQASLPASTTTGFGGGPPGAQFGPPGGGPPTAP